jgi:transcriptional regulator NrdR family protein
MYKVLKKDGSLQDFDWQKIVIAVTKAGASEDEANKVAMEVEGWLNSVAQDGVIKSYDLHVKVLEVLKASNPAAGAAFESFRKPDPKLE